MTTEKPIIVARDCPAVMVPSGAEVELKAGSKVWLTQALGGGFTLMTDQGYTVRIDGRDGDALGMEPSAAPSTLPQGHPDSVQEQVWSQLRSCFDPEIPVNIVDLGLIYDCQVVPVTGGGHKALVHFTLTAQGCGMGQFLKEDIKKKLLALAEIREAEVELVWEPAWNQSRMSHSAKHQLGIE